MPNRTRLQIALSACIVAVSACGPATSGGSAVGGPDVTVISTEMGEYRIERHSSPGALSDRIDATPQELFTLLPAVFNDLEIPIATLDASGLIIGNTRHRASRRIAGVRMSRFFRCGRDGGFGGDLAESGPLQVSIVTRVTAEGSGGARLRTEASAQARASDGTSTARSPCSSTGVLESLIVAMAEERLASR